MAQRNDRGFSLVEVIIAMFLLAVLSLAVLPLLIGATRLSVTNKDVVAANAFANAQLATLRDSFPLAPATPTSCATLQGRAVPAASAISDPAGTGMNATIEVLDTCPTASTNFPASIRVSVTVRDSAGNALATLPTRIKVSTS